MEEKDEIKEEIIVDEKEAKKQFLEELKTKNLEETQAIERAKILAALNNNGSEVITIDSIENEKDGNKNVKVNLLMKELRASLLDTAVTAVLSVAALFLFDLILRLIFGYYVADKKGVYIIIFLIILVLYTPIMNISKHGKTIGQKFGKR